MYTYVGDKITGLISCHISYLPIFLICMNNSIHWCINRYFNFGKNKVIETIRWHVQNLHHPPVLTLWLTYWLTDCLMWIFATHHNIAKFLWNFALKRAHFLDFYKSEGAPCPSAPPVPRPMTGCRAKSKFQVDFPLKKYFMHKNIQCKTIIKEHYSVKK